MAVPPVKAGTTAEEMIQCWSTLGEQHKPQIILYNLSLVNIHSKRIHTCFTNMSWCSANKLYYDREFTVLQPKSQVSHYLQVYTCFFHILETSRKRIGYGIQCHKVIKKS